MRLLFDGNLSFRLCDALADLFPQSGQVRLLGLERAADASIWERARSGGYHLVTLDSDFAEMASLYGPPPKVIWLRCGNQRTVFIEELLRRNAATIAEFDSDGEAACLELY